jgi:hypothetical protein
MYYSGGNYYAPTADGSSWIRLGTNNVGIWTAPSGAAGRTLTLQQNFYGTNSYTQLHGGKLYINDAGNVGIGDTTPDSKLDVEGGDIRISTSGYGLIFPDGTKQTTAATAGAVKTVSAFLPDEKCCTRTNAGSCGMPGYSNVLTVPAGSFLLGMKAKWEDKSTCEYHSTSTSVGIAGYSVSESDVYNAWTQTAWHSTHGLKNNILKDVTYNLGASTYIPCGGTHTSCVRNINVTLYYIQAG